MKEDKKNSFQSLLGLFSTRKASSDRSDPSAPWKSAVARSILYRVSPPLEEAGGESGKAVCALGQDGTCLRVIGFQSFAQDSAFVQNYDDEGGQLYRKLEKGHIAFYGAFPVPEEMINEHEICTQ